MKQPVWILNSSLLIVFFMSQLLLFMLQKAVPRRITMSPGALVVTQPSVIEPINLAAIYERDLFATYEAPAPVVTRIDDVVAPIPKAPKNIISEVPVEKIPTFFAPLEGILKGVIFVKDDPASSIAIIQFKKTKDEQNYQVGDLIEDAQVLKILPNRIIIVRSNGQQETLYLREEEAVHDFDSEASYMPKNVIESSMDNKYKINIDEFTKRIHNLGDFINLLDLTTAYRQGKSYGCRIGKIGPDSLGSMLGFMVDDIIIKIDDDNVADLASRLKIYDHILSRRAGDVVEVTVDRGNDSITLFYGLVDNESKNITFTKQEIRKKLIDKLGEDTTHEPALNMMHLSDTTDFKEQYAHDKSKNLQGQIISQQDVSLPVVMPIVSQQTLHEVDAHNKRLMQERDKLTPAVQDIKAQDRKNMLKQTNRNVIFNGMA